MTTGMASGKRFKWERELLSRDFAGTGHRRVTVMVVGLTLATHFNKSLTAWPSTETLAKEAGSKPDTVRKIIAMLEDVGLLRVDRRGRGAGARNTNRYHGLLPTDRNDPAGDHSPPRETVFRSPISQHANEPAAERKRAPTGTEMGPSGTPNSKEQQMNSAAPDLQKLAELKHQHSDLWNDALNEVHRRIDAGETIHKPEAYAVPHFRDLVEVRQGEIRTNTASAEVVSAITNCEHCDEDGWYWEQQPPPYSPQRIKCDHRANRGGAQQTNRSPHTK